jgi:hypothetical protein
MGPATEESLAGVEGDCARTGTTPDLVPAGRTLTGGPSGGAATPGAVRGTSPAAAGTWSTAAHFGQRAFRPANFSSTRNFAPQASQLHCIGNRHLPRRAFRNPLIMEFSDRSASAKRQSLTSGPIILLGKASSTGKVASERGTLAYRVRLTPIRSPSSPYRPSHAAARWA